MPFPIAGLVNRALQLQLSTIQRSSRQQEDRQPEPEALELLEAGQEDRQTLRALQLNAPTERPPEAERLLEGLQQEGLQPTERPPEALLNTLKELLNNRSNCHHITCETLNPNEKAAAIEMMGRFIKEGEKDPINLEKIFEDNKNQFCLLLVSGITRANLSETANAYADAPHLASLCLLDANILVDVATKHPRDLKTNIPLIMAENGDLKVVFIDPNEGLIYTITKESISVEENEDPPIYEDPLRRVQTRREFCFVLLHLAFWALVFGLLPLEHVEEK